MCNVEKYCREIDHISNDGMVWYHRRSVVSWGRLSMYAALMEQISIKQGGLMAVDRRPHDGCGVCELGWYDRATAKAIALQLTQAVSET